jgi:hypothetical protein
MPKGGNYEREVCRTLSLWLTHDRDDDQLWRSSQSGGRATVRARKGKGTKGHCGDLSATGKWGRKLLQLITIEVKRGYNKTANLHTLLDLRPRVDAEQMYESWFWQAELAAMRAGTPHWWLIHRRDGRTAVLFMPYRLWNMLTGDTRLDRPDPFIQIGCGVRIGRKGSRKRRWLNVVGMQLDHFLQTVTPEMIWEWLPKPEGKRR